MISDEDYIDSPTPAEEYQRYYAALAEANRVRDNKIHAAELEHRQAVNQAQAALNKELDR